MTRRERERRAPPEATPILCAACGRFGSAADPVLPRSIDDERPVHVRCRGIELLARALVLGSTAPNEALAAQCAELGERVRALYGLAPEEIERAKVQALERTREGRPA